MYTAVCHIKVNINFVVVYVTLFNIVNIRYKELFGAPWGFTIMRFHCTKLLKGETYIYKIIQSVN